MSECYEEKKQALRFLCLPVVTDRVKRVITIGGKIVTR
jgi:hypothetical protein